MNVNYIFSLMLVVGLFLIAYIGQWIGLQVVFGIIVPYIAIILFVGGFIYRVLDWTRSPVPFRIPTTCGQQKSLSWIPDAKIDNPTTKVGVVIRMALEILLFRSLFRNTKMSPQEGDRLSYQLEIFLWVGALAFHYAFLTTLVRHLRFFLEPVPFWLKLLEAVDGFIQLGLPVMLLSGIVLLLAVGFLLLRRIIIPHMRYISLASDYFPLFLILGIAGTGILMRYFTKVDIVSIKALTMGLVTFQFPSMATLNGIGGLFYGHLFLVCALLVYFPFSKLMHLGGIFLSPTRNLPTDGRAVRHVNPWNYPVEIHTYQEYEDEFREKMVEAGLPVEKKLPPEPAEAAEAEKE